MRKLWRSIGRGHTPRFQGHEPARITGKRRTQSIGPSTTPPQNQQLSLCIEPQAL
ncbi:hypothetical protein GQ55_4G304900 [Panicum hallii var. hallii]|uniref:Uncharacterized protein n=1 Tax=Panicum hallii var. hallii TaxID=1504633 RepID=A0A2T7E1P8_9POAL|nr:hypothetical protein GQ55_4G304900 [Panicum hallii var. hallii]